jgi:hypothetical protein
VKLWHFPARELPVTLRPFGGETIPSYAHRLARANGLPQTAILRTLGHLEPAAGRHLTMLDGKPNPAAVARLEALTGIPRARLRRALPCLSSFALRPLPTDRPAIYFRLPSRRPIPACTRCVARRATTPALIHHSAHAMVCRPHRRWISGHQHDLAPVPAILAAFHRYRKLIDEHADDPGWIARIDSEADAIVRGWLHGDARHHPDLAHRWNVRAELLGSDTELVSHAITLPERVTMLTFLISPRWRRDLALLHSWQYSSFYAQVAATTGANERTFTHWSGRHDPLRRWVDIHRYRFTSFRSEYQRNPRYYWAVNPDKGHFR